MKNCYLQSLSVALGVAILATANMAAAAPSDFTWEVVVNNGFMIPGHDDADGGAIRYYNSYNPPSVNEGALVVFRARSTGREQGPVSGIYTRDMWTPLPITINKIADRDTVVPPPNNTEYPVPGVDGEWMLSTYNEFPSFPRIAISADMVASRGNHKPVWTYEETPIQLAAHHGEAGEDETRAGTTGVYANLRARYPLGHPWGGGGTDYRCPPAGVETGVQPYFPGSRRQAVDQV